MHTNAEIVHLLKQWGNKGSSIEPSVTTETALGKPYETEVRALPTTYKWAMLQPIDRLCRSVERLYAHPLLAVGSGGSLSVCTFATHIHGCLSSQLAKAMTPLQAADCRSSVTDMSVLFPTAGGNNPDVVGAVRLIAEQEPKHLTILCGNADSRVASLARRFQAIDFIPFELPTGKDGFLATNSLLAFCVLLARAYSEVSGQPHDLPKAYGALLSDRRFAARPIAADHRYVDILARRTLLVLHGPDTAAAAIDIESKFTEAALGYVQVSDFRQFAHGRHHWLAKKAMESAILTLESADDDGLATQTLSHLPASVPVKRLVIARSGWQADLAAICEVFYVAGAAGRQQNIDPGRPGVPSFGRKLYHANAFKVPGSLTTLPKWKARSIERKSTAPIERLLSTDSFHFWSKALDTVLNNLLRTRYCGIAFDYDGTLCSEGQRFEALPTSIAHALNHILEAGVVIGVATGRGKSVRERLREAIPKRYWSHVIVGYYNGGEIIQLDAENLPDGRDHVAHDLRHIADAIQADSLLSRGDITLRYRQITLSNVHGVSLEYLCQHAAALVNRIGPATMRVMRSGHSVDIVPESVTKVAVVARLQECVGSGKNDAVLRIGDRGRWPGNDAQLLDSPHGLSVHEVSLDASTCWNIAPPGFRGYQATLWYLKHMSASQSSLRFRAALFGGE